MYDIEPHYRWREEYAVEEDDKSPFYEETYGTPRQVYNFLLNPHWDDFESETLYLKILFADYDEGYAIIEFIGEWNDTLHNDIAILKRNVLELMLDRGISRYILILENVLNFHGSDELYYEEWAEECQDSFNGGWIVALNTFDHVADEMHQTRLDNYVNFGAHFNDFNWRQLQPAGVLRGVEMLLNTNKRRLNY